MVYMGVKRDQGKPQKLKSLLEKNLMGSHKCYWESKLFGEKKFCYTFLEMKQNTKPLWICMRDYDYSKELCMKAQL